MATEQAFPASAASFGGGQIITSPFQFVADQDTFLRVTSACSVTGVRLAIQGRRLDQNGVLQAIQETHTPNSDRSVLTQDYALGAGAVLNFTVFASQGSPQIGQCYVMVQLLRNFGGTALVLGTLLGGVVTATQALGFPGSPIVASTSVEPVIRNITGTARGAGQEFSETCPTGARWELVTVTSVLRASSAAGTRNAGLGIKYGGVIGVDEVPFGSQTASLNFQYTWGQNFPFATFSGVHINQGPVPQRQFLRAGDQFLSQTQGLDVGDSWDAPLYQVREQLEV